MHCQRATQIDLPKYFWKAVPHDTEGNIQNITSITSTVLDTAYWYDTRTCCILVLRGNRTAVINRGRIRATTAVTVPVTWCHCQKGVWHLTTAVTDWISATKHQKHLESDLSIVQQNSVRPWTAVLYSYSSIPIGSTCRNTGDVSCRSVILVILQRYCRTPRFRIRKLWFMVQYQVIL